MNKKKQTLSKEDLAANAVQNQKRKSQLAQLEDLQIKAAYWKAQFEIRDYTLKAEAIQPEYDKYLETEKEKNEELQKQWKEQLDKMKENGLTADTLLAKADEKMVDVTITQDILDLNPSMVEEGLKAGDTIQVSEDPTEEGDEGVLTPTDEVTGEVEFKKE